MSLMRSDGIVVMCLCYVQKSYVRSFVVVPHIRTLRSFFDKSQMFKMCW